MLALIGILPHNYLMRTLRYVAIFLLFFCLLIGCSLDSILNLKSEAILESGDILAVTNMSAINVSLTFSYSQAASAVPEEALNMVFDRKRPSPAKPRLMDSPSAMRFNASPPPISRSSVPVLGDIIPVDWEIGDTREFWVELAPNSLDFVQISTKLIAQGDFCNIWVADDDYKPSSTKYGELATKFDQIYPLETNLLGYEYGGGPEGQRFGPEGGIDGDARIQILVHNINENSDMDGTILGYFFSIDEYTQVEVNNSYGQYYGIDKIRSNEAEIFYIDSETMEWTDPDTGRAGMDLIYSTLIHEFQHMINYSQKNLRRNINPEVWYNEMLAMLAEDVIGPLTGIGIGSGGHPVDERIPLFLDIYDWYGVDQWEDGDPLPYSTVYAFGAYLIRNFGGPALINQMLFNSSANQTSVTQAMKTVNSSYSFEYALERYAEALLYSTSKGGINNRVSFDKTATSKVNGKDYTAAAFDIWEIGTSDPDYRDLLESIWESQINVDITMNMKGPIIYRLLPSYTTPGHSVCLHNAGLSGLTSGKLNVTYTKYPQFADIRLNVYKY